MLLEQRSDISSFLSCLGVCLHQEIAKGLLIAVADTSATGA